MQRKFLAVAVIALCAIAIGAQAMGVDVQGVAHAFVLAHPEIALGLAGAAFMGDTQNFNPTEIKAALDKISGQVKEAGEKALAEAAKGIQMSTANKEKVDELLIKQGELQAQQQQVEQLLAKVQTAAAGHQPRLSLGQQFAADEKVKAFTGQATPRGRVDMTVKAAITSVTTDTDGAAGDLVVPTRLAGILSLPERRLTVRDLITPGRMDGNALEYVKETGFTNNAAPTAEGAKKPESTMKFDLVSTTAKVIAHFVKASRQIMDDASQLASHIDGRMMYGLAFKEEQQLLKGDGTGQNLLGIIPQATAFAAPFDPAGTETAIDNIRLAFLQAELAEYPSTGVVMNPIDWARIELLKDTTGRYIIGNPQGVIGATLWNRPVVATQAIDVDKFLAGAFRLGAQVFDRWMARVEIATENEDDFVKNLVTILAEERLALAVYRPESFIYGDFGYVT
ncbi:phage major capsid protein [Pseudacidovorax sp. RU35E]|uniref:phage major capsid protein n=1 Tax=Pseudacidovorax sp. RU35E TaxID=1907403 RepID=UPI000955DCFD|nr:phage major capsid protein [Pseudacidovorax sp. RU35E]SIR00043.1 phage major capsid protein, HK97 family [Pseudacidovorax sp. RU35E]